ncbi:hypothetical protein BURMUCGD1_3578 [Burkholderia multivorans CGD1]|nr:hypothetical protein BURMUCGD1_3578 [Burkholderia multivorans CGD1]
MAPWPSVYASHTKVRIGSRREPPAIPIALTPSMPGRWWPPSGWPNGRPTIPRSPRRPPCSAFVPHRIGAQDPARIDARSPLH